jgi:hypothetical protein
MDNKNLLLSLANCETENEVVTILKKHHYWQDISSWHFFGDTEDNYSTIGNQQSRPEYALVEKLINSVDALLMSKCYEGGIDPKSSDAPRTLNEALTKFFDIPEGRLSRLSPRMRTSLANNIGLIATGAKNNPSYSIIDRGEGQTPESMPDTLLGLFRSVKSEIPFVQGKFHMGGTGAFRFCGDQRMQLVLSKRNPKIKQRHENNEWGFTVVRRQAPRGNRRTSVYTYLAPNSKILSFAAESLPLWPDTYPNKFGQPMEWGTYLKLYEYNIAGLKTNILLDLYYALSLIVPNIALPVRLYERRAGYVGHSYETNLAGLSVRLEDDPGEHLEPGYPSSHQITCMGQKMSAQIYAFKPGQASNYRRKEGVIFTINGQTHAHIPSSFFQRDRVGMGYLKDSLLVIVECTNLDDRLKEDLFMNSRDRLSDCELHNQIERELERQLKNHPGLKQLREKRKQEEIKNKLQGAKPLADVLEKVIKNSPTLAKLLPLGGKLPNPFNLEEVGEGGEYQGEKYPTYFTLKKKTAKELIKNCPANWRFRVQFDTDASNDYFDRDDDPGQFMLCANGIDVLDYTLSLWNGTASLTVAFPKGIKPNHILQYNTTVKDATKWQPFEDVFKVRVEPSKKHQKGGSKQDSSQPPDKNDQTQTKRKPHLLTLPEIYDVRRNDWGNHDFDEYDALDVKSMGDGLYDFYVNIDNVCLQTEQKYAKPNADIELLTAQFRYGVVLVGISLIRELRDNGNQEKESDEEESIPDKVKLFTRAI